VVDVNLWALTLTIIVKLTGTIGTVIFVTYMSTLCQSRFIPPPSMRCSPPSPLSGALISRQARLHCRKDRLVDVFHHQRGSAAGIALLSLAAATRALCRSGTDPFRRG
jgi:hypothetical protein